MKQWKLLALTSGVASLLLSGCSQISTSYALTKDESQVAIALNKDRDVTILAVNDGERIEPCDNDPMQEQKQQSQHEPDNDRLCSKINPDDIIFEKTYKVVVRKGSTCISIWASNKRYDFCDPPYRLNF